jgi:hypothetical protein
MSRWVVLSWHLWSPRTSRTQPRRGGGAQIEHIEHLVVGDLTEAQQQAVKGWGQAYWSRIQTGTPAVQSPLAGVVDEPLFNPRYATRLTLENLNVLSSSDCESTLTAPQQDDTLALRKQASLKDSMVRLKFATDVNTNFQGTLDHIDKILDASVTSSVVAYIDGDKLVSEELPLDVLVASGAEPKSVSSLMQDEVNAINAIVASAPGYAAQSGTVSESKKLVTGQPSQADTVAVRIKALMSNLAMGDLPVERFDMAFGAYGSLPLVIVGFDSCKLIIDATNGLVLAPVPHQGTFNAQALLASHGITGDYGVRLYNSKGCGMAATGPNTPPITTPRPPSYPSYLVPNGITTRWSCAPGPLATCVCTRTLTYANNGLPGTFFVTQTCTSPGPCPVPFPTSPSPGASCNYTY